MAIRHAMRWLVMGMLSCALTACTLSRSTDAPVHTYLLAMDDSAWETAAQAMQPAADGVLIVGLPLAEAGFDQPRMAYLQRPYEVNFYATNQWADTPARMLIPLLVHSLESTGLWRAVVPMPTTVRGIIGWTAPASFYSRNLFSSRAELASSCARSSSI